MDRARLAELMAEMAAGRGGAVFALADEFGDRIAACLYRHLRHLGVAFIDPGELDGLVLDAAFELERVAGGWDPAGGALPWVWARRRMQALVGRHVGTLGEPLDLARHDDGLGHLSRTAQVPGDDPDDVAVLARLAAERADCRLLLEALDRVAPARNQQILLGVRVQASLGDPSPSVTVAREVGMRPEAIRQVVHRTRRALLALAGADPRF